MGQLFLQNQADVDALLDAVADNGLTMARGAIEYAREILSKDWLTLFLMTQNCICNLSIGKSGSVGYSLPQWAEVVQSLYDLRGTHGIEEQARRLSIPGHERLDTAFAITVAGRYSSRRWAVAFEPNGKGCSDLRLSQESHYFYVEVKRQNTQDHVRFNRFTANSSAILSSLPSALTEWLKENDCRVQVKFSGGLSPSLVTAICNELSARVPHALVGVGQTLTLPKKSEFVLLRRDSEQHFKKGLTLGRVIVPTTHAIQLTDPRNTLVQIVFDWLPNLGAIRAQINKAKQQLQRDVMLCPGATGFIVIEANGGERLAASIEERFLPNFPPYCLGVTLVPDIPVGGGQIVFQDSVDAETLQLMGYAANMSASLVSPAKQN
jgi:hypothetical protein